MQAVSLRHYTNHYCAIVIIILQLNLPVLYAETIELIPTRKWQLVMWGKMDFTMLWYCEGPWDNTVNTIKHCLNWFLCEMCNAWIKAYWLVVRCQQLCCVHVSLHAHRLPESDDIMYWFIFDELHSYLKSDFPHDKHDENLQIQCVVSAINNNQDKEKAFERCYDVWLHSSTALGKHIVVVVAVCFP